MFSISLVIVTYQSQNDILNCLESVYVYADIPAEELEIIIVDNSSRAIFQETEALVRGRYDDRIVMIHNTANGGYGQGNNIGIARASADLVCISNPDVLFTAPVFRKALELFQNDRRLAMAGGRQTGGPDFSYWIRPEYEFYILTRPLTTILNRVGVYFENYFFLSGAFLFVDRQKFNEVGRFDETMFLYGEEADLSRRFMDHGYKTLYRADFSYRHLIDGRSGGGDNDLENMLNSYSTYFEKHQMSFRRYLRSRMMSCRIIIFASKVMGNAEVYKKNKKYLELFERKLASL